MLAPKPPSWLLGDYQTVGSLGRVIRRATDGHEGELRTNASVLFQSEFGKAKAHRRRWQESPNLGTVATVSGRRLLASTDGHLRLEISLNFAGAVAETLQDLLDAALTALVRVARAGESELIAIGTPFAGVYLNESAKTAERSDQELLRVLVREGIGSPFIVVVWPHEATKDAQFWFEPEQDLVVGVSCTLMQLGGQDLGVWQIWNVPPVWGWITYPRGLSRIICNLGEVTLLTGLLDPEAMRPYSLSIPAVDGFLRQRVGQLRRKQRDGWPVMQVQARAAKHLRVSIADEAELRSSLSHVRRDVAGDTISILKNIVEAGQNAPAGVTTGMPIGRTRAEMRDDDKKTLVELLARKAVDAGDSEAYFRALLERPNIPREFRTQRLHLLRGRVEDVARQTIEWALNQGINPSDKRYATLGSLLVEQLPDLGLEDRTVIVSAMLAYGLIRDPVLSNALRIRYQVPHLATDLKQGPEIGPDFAWRGPADDVTLQAWLRPEPILLDMGLLRSAVERARSVCQIAVSATGYMGTGVLVADDLILTNYHVIGPENLEANAKTVTVIFGNYTGSDKAGRTELKLAEHDPITEKSPTTALDFVLLRVDPAIMTAPGIQPAQIFTDIPELKTSMNILQHPEGGEMKLAISDDSVTYVDRASGIVQYATRAFSGSSGSPCFDPAWRLVALHHAERAKSFGRIREGILMSSIYPLIAKHVSSG